MERMNTMIKHMKQRKASFRIKHALQYLEKLDDHEKLIDELRGEWMGFIAREIVKNIQEDEKD